MPNGRGRSKTADDTIGNPETDNFFDADSVDTGTDEIDSEVFAESAGTEPENYSDGATGGHLGVEDGVGDGLDTTGFGAPETVKKNPHLPRPDFDSVEFVDELPEGEVGARATANSKLKAKLRENPGRWLPVTWVKAAAGFVSAVNKGRGAWDGGGFEAKVVTSKGEYGNVVKTAYIRAIEGSSTTARDDSTYEG